MCGIAGHVHARSAFSSTVADQQLALLCHRGPDSQGHYGRGRGVVGQTRLSIIDLVTGDPPLTDESGDIGVAFNGEIYTYAALTAQLRAAGHTFRSTGDTEVIAHLAEEHTPVDLGRALDGMYAAAVWYAQREELVLIRDRMGKKPLHWWCDGQTFVFGSEIKSVLAHPAVTARLDPDAIPAFLRFGYVPTPRTFYEGIHSVRPGHVLVVDRDLRVTEQEYWSPAPAAGIVPLDVSLDEAAALVHGTFEEAVRRRLVADVPLGAFLSGGVDSSAIVATMARLADRPVQTFTIGFEDADGFDERPYARMVADRFGTEHTEFVVAPRAVDLVERLVWHHDQPFGDSSAIPTFLLSELTRQHVTVALSGDGGDELFAGYERFAAGVFAGAIAGRLGRATSAAAGVLPRRGRTAKARRFLQVAGRGLPDAYRQWVSTGSDEIVERLTGRARDWSIDDYAAQWAWTEGSPSTLDRLLLLNLRTYLVDDLLVKADRMSMAHGLEVRAPFLDTALVELAFRLPAATKQRGTSLKRCLKRAFRDELPAEILDRPKRGFGVPLDRWFRDDLAAFVTGTIGSPEARIRRHLDGDAIDVLLAEHRAGRSDHGHVLWSLLTLETFLGRLGW